MSSRHPSRARCAPLALSVAVVAALGAGDAMASAFQLKENSAQGLGRAFAGNGAAPGDYAVVVNNPAAMSELERSGFQADLTGINVSMKFHGEGTDALGRPLTGSNRQDAGATKPVPAMYYATPVGERWAFGVGVSAPYGFVSEYDAGWVGRYHALKSELQSIATTFSASYRLSDSFSIGGSVIAQHTSADLSKAIDFGAILAGPTGGAVLPQAADGKVRIEGDDWGYGWQLGLLWKPTDRDRIGLNYHSKIDHEIQGDATFTVPQAIAPLLGPTFQSTGGNADFTTPAFAELSWWHTHNERLSYGATYGWTRWSTFKDLTVTFDNPAQPDSSEIFRWRNSTFGSVGAEYKLSDALVLRGGLAVDGSPTYEGTRSPRVPDATRRWVALGLGYAPSDAMRFDVGYAHLFVNDSHVDVRGETGDHVVARYENYGNLLAVSGQFRF